MGRGGGQEPQQFGQKPQDPHHWSTKPRFGPRYFFPMVCIQYRDATDRRTDRHNSASVVNYQKFPKKEVMKLPTVFDDKNAHFPANKTKSANAQYLANKVWCVNCSVSDTFRPTQILHCNKEIFYQLQSRNFAVAFKTRYHGPKALHVSYLSGND